MTPTDIERKVRDMMYPCSDDREVAWQVAHCIEVGRVEWFTITGRPTLRTEGPATLEVHERDERIARERPDFERQIRAFVLAEFERDGICPR